MKVPKHVHIVYASTSGNVEIVCEEVAKVLATHHYTSELHRAERTSVDVIMNNPVIVFATSTWEHGRINPFFDKLVEAMQGKNLQHLQAGFIGLGDRRYEPVRFCEGMETLKQVVLDDGATQIGSLLKINGEPYGLLDTEVADWARGFIFDLEAENDLAI